MLLEVVVAIFVVNLLKGPPQQDSGAQLGNSSLLSMTNYNSVKFQLKLQQNHIVALLQAKYV
jgi:hypothetical protein